MNVCADDRPGRFAPGLTTVRRRLTAGRCADGLSRLSDKANYFGLLSDALPILFAYSDRKDSLGFKSEIRIV